VLAHEPRQPHLQVNKTLELRGNRILYKKLRLLALTSLLFTILSGSDAHGQVFRLGMDLNTSSHDISPGYQGAPRTKSTGPSFLFGWYSNSFRYNDSDNIYGIVIHRRKLTTQTSSLDQQELEYNATSVQFAFDHKIYRYRRLLLTGGFDFGLNFVTDKYDYESCDTAFCDLPGTSWELSPGLRLKLPYNYSVSLFIEARGTLYLGKKESSYPFKSGAELTIGIQINGFKSGETNSNN